MKVSSFGKDVPPLKEHVIIYFIQKGCLEKEAINFFMHYNERNWKNNRGTTLSNWKMTAWEWILKKRPIA